MRELELLTALVERRDRIVSREELYRVVWGEPYRKSDRSVDVYVGQAAPQAASEALPGRRFIHTHFGFGYRFAPDRDAVRPPSHPFSQGGDSSITDCPAGRCERPRRQ